MDVGLIGPVRVAGQDAGLGTRDRVVLSVLALRPGEVASRDRIADALWPEGQPETWPKVVQGCVMRLRKALGPNSIETTPRGYRLHPDSVHLDTSDFETLIGNGHSLLAAGDGEGAVTTLAGAVRLWRGRPFQELEEWPPGQNEATRLTELLHTAEEDLLEARLATGDQQTVVADALVLVAEHPLRERRWATLAAAQYRCGQQAEALHSIQRARTMFREELGLDLGAELVALEGAILAQDPALDAVRSVHVGTDCPYKGLLAYDLSDRDRFFGRRDEVASCLKRLSGTPLLALVGPSGCGKSSLLRAGLQPALADLGRRTVLFTPGPDPESTMAAAIASFDEPPAILVDQFEEVFTQCLDPDARLRWMESVATYATTQAPVMITVRADHVSGLGAPPGFAALVEAGLHLVPSLSGDNLRAAIQDPAEDAGLLLEHGLVDLAMRDTEGEPGALPLMSHALAETWQRRDGRTLTVDGYRAAGGIRGAVARSADRLYEGLDVTQRQLLRGILLRLVVAAPDGEPVRLHFPSHVFAADPSRARLVELLVRARLVTAEDGTLEVAHEALARAWPRLRSWLDEDAGGQRIRSHLSAAALGWDSLGRPQSELYRGARLEATLEWSAANGNDLTLLERAFLDSSSQRATSERHELARRARHQASQNRQLRWLLAGVAALLLASAVATSTALSNGRHATAQRDRATAAVQSARHDALVARSLALRDTNRSAAALLAIEAYREKPDALGRSALLGAFTAPNAEGFMGYHYVPDGLWLNGTVVPHSHNAVLAVNGRYLRLVDLDDGSDLPDQFPYTAARVGGTSILRVSADGRMLVQLANWAPRDPRAHCGEFRAFNLGDARRCSRVSVYDLHRGGRRVLGPFRAPFAGSDVAINADGSLVAVAGGRLGSLAVYRVSDARLLGTVTGRQRPNPVQLEDNRARVTFGTRGRVYLGSTSGEIRELSARTVAPRRSFVVAERATSSGLVFTRSGVLVAAGRDALTAVDTGSGRSLWTVDLRRARGRAPCPFLAVGDQVGRVYCGNYGGQIIERDLATGSLTGRSLDPQLGRVGDLSVTGDNGELVAFNDRLPVLSRWQLGGSGLVTRTIADGYALADGFARHGRWLLVTSGKRAPYRTVDVWDVTRDRSLRHLAAPGGATWASPNLLAVLGRSRGTFIYDVARGRASDTVRVDPGAQKVFRTPSGTTFFTATPRSARRPTTWRISRVDTRTGRVSLAFGSVPAYEIMSVSTDPTAANVLVTSDGAQVLESSVYDGRTGSRLTSGLPFQSQTVIGPGGSVIGSTDAGPITAYDLDTLRDVARFPGTRGTVTSMQLARDARTLLVTSADQTIQLFDVQARLRLADPIPAASPESLVQGWLRPDGNALAVTTNRGVTLWDIDSRTLLRQNCALSGRNLSLVEWATYFGGDTEQRGTCDRAYTPPD